MKRSLPAALLALAPMFVAASPSFGGGGRPVVAVIGENEGSETTDFIVPYGVLTASGVAEVIDVAVEPGPLHLMPALTLQPRETIDTFDAAYPRGADFVVVPAMHRSDGPKLRDWLRRQAGRGATIVAICEGARVVAGAGLLENRAATTHWYALPSLEKEYAHTRWLRDRRYVSDGPVMTTTGVSASMPASLALVERIAGRERAAALAEELGVATWGDSHQSALYHLTARDVATAARNLLTVWNYERVGVPVAPGVDEIVLAFSADALARTYRSTAVSLGAGTAPVATKRGLTLLPDEAADAARVARVVPVDDVPPGRALDRALAAIAASDGESTARFVALQLEYPWSGEAM